MVEHGTDPRQRAHRCQRPIDMTPKAMLVRLGIVMVNRCPPALAQTHNPIIINSQTTGIDERLTTMSRHQRAIIEVVRDPNIHVIGVIRFAEVRESDSTRL